MSKSLSSIIASPNFQLGLYTVGSVTLLLGKKFYAQEIGSRHNYRLPVSILVIDLPSTAG